MVMKNDSQGQSVCFWEKILTQIRIYPGRFVEYTDVEDIKKICNVRC